MRNIVSPLSGIVSPFGLRDGGALSVYAVVGLEPPLVLDFDDTYYRTGGTATDLVSAATHARAGNATMVDSDGVLKWAPHNLLTYSEDFTNAAWPKTNVTVAGTVVTPNATLGTHRVDFPTYTSNVGRVTAKARVKPNGYSYFGLREQSVTGAEAVFFLSGAGTVPYSTAGTGSSLVTSISFDGEFYDVELSISFTGSSSAVRAYVLDANPASNLNSYSFSGDTVSGIEIETGHLYRSDLGGMVNNPSTGDSYVPTTDSARYLPRVGHHIWNGSAWVDEGYFHESEARTNLVTYSQDFTDASWVDSTVTRTADEIGPDGLEDSAYTLTDTTASTSVFGQTVVCANDTAARTLSVFVKKTVSAATFPGISIYYSGGTSINSGITLNTDTGVATARSGGGVSAPDRFAMQDFGDYWRASVTVSNNGTNNTSVLGYISPAVNTNGSGTWVATTGSFVAYGAQVEAGSTPSSYIPTSGSTVTRAADTLTIPSANLPWPTPEVIGPELVNPADWTGNDGTTLPSSITVTDGTVILNDASFADTAENIIGYVSGTPVAVTVDVTITSGNIQIWLGGTATEAGQIIVATTSGSYTFYNGVSGTTGALYVRSLAGGTTGTVDNISVREINPLAVSIQMEGTMTYAEDGGNFTVQFTNWEADSNNNLTQAISTAASTGDFRPRQEAAGVADAVQGLPYSPGINVPFNIASLHGSTFINGAVDGTALTANTTPTALPDLSSTDMQIGSTFMGTIKLFRVWADDLTDEGIEEASTNV